MARLLTLALSETTRGNDGYQVVAFNFDTEKWVTLKVPMDEFTRNDQPVWDLFSWTQADLQPLGGREAPEVNRVMPGSIPMLIGRIDSLEERSTWLDDLHDREGVRAIHKQGRFVGLVKAESISAISLRQRLFGPDAFERTSAWSSNMSFSDGVEFWGNHRCKDMRWKHYWVDMARRRPDDMQSEALRLATYMNTHETYFFVRMWRWPGRHGDFRDSTDKLFAISGVLCLPVEKPLDEEDALF